MTVFSSLYEGVKKQIDLPDSSFYDISNANNIFQDAQSGKTKYPVVLILDPSYYSATLNQDGMNLANEVRTDGLLFFRIFSDDVDALIRVEEAITSRFASPQKLSDVCEDERLKFAAVSFDAEKKIERNKLNNGVIQSTLIMKYEGVILPKEVVNPIKVELDTNTQLAVMKHLYLLDLTLFLIEEEMESAQPDMREAWKIRHSAVEQQISEMYTFEKLCAEKISASDHGFVYCYSDMIKNKHDIAQATAAYRQKHEQEKKAEEAKKAKAEEINQKYSKSGDKSLNRYTDAVVEDIRNKLHLSYPVGTYGGSSFMEFYRRDGLGQLHFPCMLVKANSNFVFDKKTYTNIDRDGSPVIHPYSPDALPLNFGALLVILAEEEAQANEIKEQFEKMYTDEVQLKVPDTVQEGEFVPIKMVIDKAGSVSKPSSAPLYRSIIQFKRFPIVYYPYVYASASEISDNQRLQVRLLQQAEFYLLCDLKFRKEAIPQLDSEYKDLFTQNQKKSFLGSMVGAIGSAFESQEYKQVKECFKYGRPVDRQLFDKAFAKITSIYPSLYDKMTQGWTPEQLHAEFEKYANLFSEKWNTICNDLCLASFTMSSQLHLSGKNNQPTEEIRKGLVFYIQKMVDTPACTLSDAVTAYTEQLRIEAEAQRERDRQNQETLEAWSESLRERRQNRSSGGFFSNMMSTAGGVALGNKISGTAGAGDQIWESYCPHCGNTGETMVSKKQPLASGGLCQNSHCRYYNVAYRKWRRIK